MRSFFSILLVAIMLIYPIFTAIAVPAYPGLVNVKQPDGTTISLYLKGDEKVHWMESEDGYSLMYDNNKSIVYAISDEKGDMIPSSVVAREFSTRSTSDQSFLKDIPKKLRYSEAQINTLKSIWEIVPKSSNTGSIQFRAAVGDAKAICALVGFLDKPVVKTKEEFNNLMNQAGYSAVGAIGSVNDYYYENSYGKLNLVVTVAGPYTLAKNWSYYGENDTNGNDKRVQEFAKEAANFVFKDPGVNPGDFDNDGNGKIDAFHIIYAGYGEEAGGGDDCIWAHKSGFYPALTFGNKKLDVYSCSPELRGKSGSNLTHIGVICHELCHVFGAPDFYDVDYEGSGGNFDGTGTWDLMANGSWNNGGACPAHINMYQKIQFGWVTPEVLTQQKTITNMPNSAMNAVAYRYNTSTSGEYFILENRQKTGFDRYLAGTGLLIYRVSVTNTDISNNTVNNKYPQKVYPVCASANTNPTGTPASYGDINSAGCPFPGNTNKTSFTDYSIPSATAQNGDNTIKSLTEIKEQNGVISFKFMMLEDSLVSNFQAISARTTVQLTWNMPASEGVIGYNIYRDDLLQIQLTGKDNTSYTQYNVKSGYHKYSVTAVYSDNESYPVSKTIQIFSSPIDDTYLSVHNLEVRNINDNKEIELNWESPFASNWISHAGSFAKYVRPSTGTFISAVKFTVDDLQHFSGSKLTKVRFSVNDLQCKYTIQVWITNAGSNNPTNTPVVNQLINNPKAPDNNFEVILDSPVDLVNNKELWIGIKYELSPMTQVAGVDKGPIVPQRNYLFSNNQWSSVSTLNNFNWYISGYLQYDNTVLNAPSDDWLRSATATDYVIYRDNVKIAATKQTNYVDSQPKSGSHIYCVSVAYDDDNESEPVCVQASNIITSLETVNNPEEEINIYPNPVKKGEILEINCDPNTVSTLSVYTISGQLVEQEQVTGPVFNKKMNFEPGIYLMQIKNYSKSFIRKIIIK